MQYFHENVSIPERKHRWEYTKSKTGLVSFHKKSKFVRLSNDLVVNVVESRIRRWEQL